MDFRDQMANWMDSVDEQRHISSLSIPGTHDSLTFETDNRWARCQSADLVGQFLMGVRFIDVRLKQKGEHLIAYHGKMGPPFTVELRSHFTDIIKSCRDFLDSHCNECILMSIDHESDYPDREKFTQLVNAEIKKNPDWFYVGNEIPQLKHVRKKIVILRRFDEGNERKNIGINLSRWESSTEFHDTNSDGIAYSIQDQYSVGITEKDDKFEAIKAQFQRAKKDSNLMALYFNFTSGTGLPLLNPKDVADYENPRWEDHLKNVEIGRYGIVPGDFVTERMYACYNIVKNNVLNKVKNNHTYIIHAKSNSNHVFDLNGFNRNNGAAINSDVMNGGWNQLWTLKDAGEGYFYIIAGHLPREVNAPEKVITILNGNYSDNNQVVIDDNKGQNHQKWKIHYNNDETFRVVTKNNNSLVLDNTVDRGHIVINPFDNDSQSQKWIFTF